VLEREAHQLVAPVQVELAEDVADVVLHGLLGDVQLLTDLAVGVPAGDQSQHLPLPLGERLRAGGRLGEPAELAQPNEASVDENTGSPPMARLSAATSSGPGVDLTRYPTAPAATASSRSRSCSETVNMTMRVSAPQARTTAIPPPSGMLRSQTARSGRVVRMTLMASLAVAASPTTSKSEPRSALTPSRQIGWSSASTTDGLLTATGTPAVADQL
jgi:hypothetical protein